MSDWVFWLYFAQLLTQVWRWAQWQGSCCFDDLLLFCLGCLFYCFDAYSGLLVLDCWLIFSKSHLRTGWFHLTMGSSTMNRATFDSLIDWSDLVARCSSFGHSLNSWSSHWWAHLRKVFLSINWLSVKTLWDPLCPAGRFSYYSGLMKHCLSGMRGGSFIDSHLSDPCWIHPAYSFEFYDWIHSVSP